MINLNRESWHARYYKFATERDDLPKSLCPYFWSLVLMIAVFPVLVLFRIGDHFVNTQWNRRQVKLERMDPETRVKFIAAESKKMDKMEKFAATGGKVLLGILLFLVAVLLVAAFIEAVAKLGWIKTLLITLGILGGISLFVWLMVTIITRDKIGDRFKRTIIVSMIRSAYEKACPLISWTENVKA